MINPHSIPYILRMPSFPKGRDTPDPFDYFDQTQPPATDPTPGELCACGHPRRRHVYFDSGGPWATGCVDCHCRQWHDPPHVGGKLRFGGYS